MVAILMVSFGCGESDSPAAPLSVSVQEAPDRHAEGSVPEGYDRGFYRQLVFDAGDYAIGRKDDLAMQSFIFPNAENMNFIMYRGDLTGQCSIGIHSIPSTHAGYGDINYRNNFATHTGPVVARATGKPFFGTLQSTANRNTYDRLSETTGWIGIAFEHCEYSDRRFDERSGCDYVGYASVGRNPGYIRILLQPDCALWAWNDARFNNYLAHEIGHTLGFYHVFDEGHMMGSYPRPDDALFSDKEARHMRLAFYRGRGEARFGLPPAGAPDRVAPGRRPRSSDVVIAEPKRDWPPPPARVR